MSNEQTTQPVASASGAGARLHPTMDQAAIAAAHRSIKKSFDLFAPIGEKTSLNSLDSVLAKAYLLVDFNPQEVIPPFTVDDMEDMASLFPSVEELVTSNEFYTMTTIMIRTFHRMFDLRKIQNIEVPPAVAAKFYPMKKFKAVHEKLWLLCLLGADVNDLMAFSDFMAAPAIRRSMGFSQVTHHSPARETPPVQRRVSFHPSSTEEVTAQANTPTSYIQPPTPAPRNESATGYGHAEPLTNTPEDPAIQQFPYVTTRQEQPRNIRNDSYVPEGSYRQSPYEGAQPSQIMQRRLSSQPSQPHTGHGPNIEENSHVSQQKKAVAVDQYFKNTKFGGHADESFEDTLRDFDICAVQQNLTPSERSLFFVNALKGSARSHFLNKCSSDMPFKEIVYRMRHQFNSEAKRQQLWNEIMKLHLPTYMADNKITSEKEGLRSLVDYIERMSPLLEPEFRTEKHKITFLRNAVLPYSWAQFPISQISTARFTFYGFSTSLESCLT